MKKYLLLAVISTMPLIANAQWGVGMGAFTSSFNQSYASQSQAAAAQAQVAAQLAAMRQIKMQQREQYGTREIKRLDQQEAFADQKLSLIIVKLSEKAVVNK